MCTKRFLNFHLECIKGALAAGWGRQAVLEQVLLLVAHRHQEVHCGLLGLGGGELPQHRLQALQELLYAMFPALAWEEPILPKISRPDIAIQFRA